MFWTERYILKTPVPTLFIIYLAFFWIISRQLLNYIILKIGNVTQSRSRKKSDPLFFNYANQLTTVTHSTVFDFFVLSSRTRDTYTTCCIYPSAVINGTVKYHFHVHHLQFPSPLALPKGQWYRHTFLLTRYLKMFYPRDINLHYISPVKLYLLHKPTWKFLFKDRISRDIFYSRLKNEKYTFRSN